MNRDKQRKVGEGGTGLEEDSYPARGSFFSPSLSPRPSLSRRISRLYEALLHTCVEDFFIVRLHVYEWTCTLDRDGAARRLIGHHLAWLQSAISLSLSLYLSLSLACSALLPIINLRKFLISLLRRPALSLCLVTPAGYYPPRERETKKKKKK